MASKNLEKTIDNVEKALAKADPGSEESVALLRELEVTYELKKNSDTVEIERDRLDLDKSKAEEEKKWYNRVPWGTVAAGIATGLVSLGIAAYEKSGEIFKAKNIPKLIK